MLRVHHTPAVICVLLVACGGKIVTSESSGSTTGSGGGSTVSGTTTGDTSNQPDITDPGIVEPGTTTTTSGAGGAPTSTPCGPTTCGPGLYCCNASCGVCSPPNVGCDFKPCGRPVIDAGPGPIIHEGPDFGSGRGDYGYPWKDSWFIRGCQTKAGHDCITINVCPNGGAPNFEDRGAVTTELFPVGGEPGTTFAVTFQVNGIAEAKYYQGGTRDAGDAIPDSVETADLDMFYRGGTPVPSNYDVLRMRIFDSTKKEVARYYMNSAPQASGMESHRTFRLSYSKTIDVPGGGYVEYLTADSNCHSIDNCGPGNVSDTSCLGAQGIPHEEANPLPATGIDPVTKKSVPLATLNSVNGSVKPWHSQIVHLTIIKAVAK